MKNAISGVLNLAVDEEVLPANPAHKVGKIFTKQNMSPLMDPLNRSGLSQLLKTFKDWPKFEISLVAIV